MLSSIFGLVSLSVPFVMAANVSFPFPTGPYYVAQTQHVFKHETPNDPVASPPNSTGTFFLVTFYYPSTQIPPSNQTQPYFDAVNAQLWQDALEFPNGTLSNLTTNFQFQATTLNSSTGKPTLIFSPGGGEGTVEYTALLSDLASHGYIVAALDHPGEPPYLPLPYTDPPEGVYGLDITSGFTPEQIHQIYTYRLTDIEAFLDWYPFLVASFGAPFNTTHYGLFGHSIGGAASAGILARQAASPNSTYTLLGGTNLDGSYFDFFGSEASSYPDLAAPFFQFGEIARKNASFDPGVWANLSSAQTGWIRTLLVKGTLHQDFSDLPVWVDVFDLEGKTLTPVGPLPGKRAMKIVRTYVGAFFDYVSGLGGDMLFEDKKNREFPEIVYVKDQSKGGDLQQG